MTAPVTTYLPVVLSGRGSSETRWYRNTFEKVIEFTAEDFTPFASVRETTTPMFGGGEFVSRKVWDFSLAEVRIPERVVICEPYRIAKSKSDHLIIALIELGWRRCKEEEVPR